MPPPNTHTPGLRSPRICLTLLRLTGCSALGNLENHFQKGMVGWLKFFFILFEKKS
jgi:hypothetical protein